MIGKLKGILDDVDEDIASSTSTASAMSPSARRARWPACRRPATAVTLFIETYVREDMICGSTASGLRSSASGSACCRACQGVGAKVALAVLSTLPPAELADAMALRDIATVSRARAWARRWPSASSPS